jgi:imidazolonepropionase-like amidohydrolase
MPLLRGNYVHVTHLGSRRGTIHRARLSFLLLSKTRPRTPRPGTSPPPATYTPIMRIRTLLIVAFLFALIPANATFASDLALVGAKVYLSPNEPPLENATILIRNGTITAVGPSSTTKPPRLARAVTVINCKGLVVTAGFWNSHVHMFTPALLHPEKLSSVELTAQLEAMLTRWGFTTVFDIASVLESTNSIRRRIESGEVRGPRILTVGAPFYPEGGTPIYVKSFLEENHVPSAEVASPQQAVDRLRQQLRGGADGAKIFAGAILGGGKVLIMPLDIASAIVAEAHRAGKPVFAHPSNTEGVELCLQSDVDILAHTTPMSGPWTPELVERLKAANMALIPTLTLFQVESKKFGASEEESAQVDRDAAQQLKSYSDAGGQILFGTDAGYIDQFDTAQEFKLMSRAGLTFPQILASLTTNPAQRFGAASHSGRIAKNYDADLVVLSADPSQDITALSKVSFTIRVGKIVFGKP